MHPTIYIVFFVQVFFFHSNILNFSQDFFDHLLFKGLWFTIQILEWPAMFPLSISSLISLWYEIVLFVVYFLLNLWSVFCGIDVVCILNVLREFEKNAYFAVVGVFCKLQLCQVVWWCYSRELHTWFFSLVDLLIIDRTYSDFWR